MTRELFISLVSKTTPNGFEYLMDEYIPNPNFDQFGNRYIIIGEGPHRHLFTCHLDTYPLTNFPEEVTIIEHGDIIKTDGKTLLGADDKAGMTVLLTMIKAGIPGIYGFFLAEEIGRLGSEFATQDPIWLKMMQDVKAVISFDRKGTNSIITKQRKESTCSIEYAKQLQLAFQDAGLSLKLDPKGSVTDSYSFFEKYPEIECTNISVGYEKAHSVNEYQNITYLERLCNAVTRMKWPIP